MFGCFSATNPATWSVTGVGSFPRSRLGAHGTLGVLRAWVWVRRSDGLQPDCDGLHPFHSHMASLESFKRMHARPIVAYSNFSVNQTLGCVQAANQPHPQTAASVSTGFSCVILIIIAIITSMFIIFAVDAVFQQVFHQHHLVCCDRL